MMRPMISSSGAPARMATSGMAIPPAVGRTNGRTWAGPVPPASPASLAPIRENSYRRQALKYSDVIGKHPQSFPDTHASPPMGMAYEALGANIDPKNFRKLMDANRWWFTMAQCGDETFYYQPNRDNSGYDSSARMTASSRGGLHFHDSQTKPRDHRQSLAVISRQCRSVRCRPLTTPTFRL